MVGECNDLLLSILLKSFKSGNSITHVGDGVGCGGGQVRASDVLLKRKPAFVAFIGNGFRRENRKFSNKFQ